MYMYVIILSMYNYVITCISILGAIVQQVLSALQQLDTHSFTTCKYHSPLSTLFVKILQAQKNEVYN